MRTYLNKRISTSSNGIRNSSGIGYVILQVKNNSQRKKYIQNCTLQGSVSIALEEGGFLENVQVLKHVWNDIEFPTVNTKLGSCVMWNKLPYNNNIVIVGVLPKSNEVLNINENQFLLERKFEDKLVEISGDAKNAKLLINLDGGNNDASEFIISVSDKNSKSKLNLIIKGDLIFDISNSFTYKDKNKNNVVYNSKGIQLNPKKSGNKVKFGEGNEPLLLGDTVGTFLQDFVNAVASITVTTALGTMPILNMAQVLALLLRIQQLKSRLSYTD